ncbi:MAG: GNAT family N-acetyltransferase [Bryobacteraceae bacterium]|jgi:ribosomal protein S18 acetylase RimI-like enzyme
MKPCDITLRDAGDADRPFLLALYAATREAEMAMVPWTASQKRAFVEMQFAAQLRGYAETHPAAAHQIILVADRPAGRIYLDRGEREIHILDITVAPACRNSGIGSAVLREVLTEADRTGKTVGIYVEDFNPSRQLFERLGFCVAAQDGFQLLLERSPGAMTVSQS